jgi:hypothetical protein
MLAAAIGRHRSEGSIGDGRMAAAASRRPFHAGRLRAYLAMSLQVPRGPARVPVSGGVVDRLTTGQMIQILRGEGWHVTQRMVNHAESIGAIPRPPRVGHYRQWRGFHLDTLREYLRTQSRSQRPAIGGEVLS